MQILGKGREEKRKKGKKRRERKRGHTSPTI
jgi:hypothetical protein